MSQAIYFEDDIVNVKTIILEKFGSCFELELMGSVPKNPTLWCK